MKIFLVFFFFYKKVVLLVFCFFYKNIFLVIYYKSVLMLIYYTHVLLVFYTIKFIKCFIFVWVFTIFTLLEPCQVLTPRVRMDIEATNGLMILKTSNLLIRTLASVYRLSLCPRRTSSEFTCEPKRLKRNAENNISKTSEQKRSLKASKD